MQKKRIVFFSVHSLSVLRLYWDQLSKDHECWWLIYNRGVYEEALSLGYGNIIFNDINEKTNLFNLVLITKKIFKKILNLTCKRYNQFTKEINFLKPDIVISDTGLTLENYCPYKKNTMTVIVFHFICFKKHIISKNAFLFDMCLVPTKYYFNQLKIRYENSNKEKISKGLDSFIADKAINDIKTHKYSHGKKGTEVSIVGWPRGDNLININYGESQKKNFLKKINLNPKNKTFLYAPSWNAYYKLGLFLVLSGII